MASRTDQQVTLRILRQVLKAAKAQAYPKVLAASKTLARALEARITPSGAGSLYIPHYWAKYVHDGRRGGFGPLNGKFMIFWRNYREDPRLRGRQTPSRLANLRRLTTAEVKAARKRNKAHLRAGGDPTQMPVIFTEEIKNGTKGAFFFDNTKGMKGIERKVGIIARAEVRAQVRSILRSSLRGAGGGARIRV